MSMQPKFRNAVMAALLALAGIVVAEIPGVFVVQEARIGDPFALSFTGKRFGGSGLAWVGDVNRDGVQDVLVGAARSYSDSGSIQIIRLGADGKQVGLPLEIQSRDPKIAPFLTHVAYAVDNFGGSVEVVQKFTATQDCAILATASTNVSKLWSIRICRDGSGVAVDSVNEIDSLNSPVLGGFGVTRIGESIRMVDTLADGKVVLAIGIPQAVNPLNAAYTGSVLLASLDPKTLVWGRVGRFPQDWTAADPIFKNIATSGPGFGRSVARIAKSGGILRLAVTSTGDKPVARVHIVDLNSQYQVLRDTAILPVAGGDTIKNVWTVSSADFDHDGNTDLLIGQPQATGANLATGVGGFSVALLDKAAAVRAIRQFGNWGGGGGFIDSANTLGEKVYLGMEVLAGDFDGDNQMDVVIGSPGSTTIGGSIWPLRLKSKPWSHKPGDTLKLGTQPNGVHLSDYVTGNRLNWTVTEVNPPATGSLANCTVTHADSPDFVCTPANTNGLAHWKLIASDSGNLPATDHFVQQLDFVVQISGVNQPPVKTAALPAKVSLHEDQADTAALVLSHFFRDPDGPSLSFALVPLNGSTTNLLATAKMTAIPPFDTLHLQPMPLRYGLCSLQVSIRDDKGATLLDTLVVEVLHANHAPQAFDDSYSITESTPTRLDVLKNDKDVDIEDVLMLTLVTPPKHGKADTSSRQILFTPDSFYLGRDSLQYRLGDGSSAALAWVRIAVGATTDPLRVYKALRDTTVIENDSSGPRPIVIHTDSLFFSGALRFRVGVYEATSDCQSIAKISHDRTNSMLIVTPLRYQWGKCSISIKEMEKGVLTSTMNLSIASVLTPYEFPKDTLVLSIQVGQQLVIPLDSIDLDKDTLSYSISGDAWPSWIQLKGHSLVFRPDMSSLDTRILVVSRKKALQGVTFTDSTDVLTLIAQVNSSSVRPRGQRMGGATLWEEGHRLVVTGGGVPFRIEVLSLDGRRLAMASGPERGQIHFDSRFFPRLLFLRLTEGPRMSISPFLLHR